MLRMPDVSERNHLAPADTQFDGSADFEGDRNPLSIFSLHS